MSSDNNRNIGLSEIIRMLENNVTFTQAADSVLECITDSMDICDAVVMQIDRENDTMHVISETGNCFKDESGTVKRSEFVLCSDAIKITYEGNADTAQKGLLDRLGVKLSITVPILINNVKAMYLIVLSNDVQAVSDNKIKEYIKCTIRLKTFQSHLFKGIEQKTSSLIICLYHHFNLHVTIFQRFHCRKLAVRRCTHNRKLVEFYHLFNDRGRSAGIA